MEIEKNKGIIAILVIIIIILVVGVGYQLMNHQNNAKPIANNTTIKNTTVKNATLTETSSSSNSESGQYGYCAICGKALSYDEAHNEFTQGKVCTSCAQNPYYQTDEGAKYANQKLYESYPDEYAWMYEDHTADTPVDTASDTLDEYDDYDDFDYISLEDDNFDEHEDTNF